MINCNVTIKALHPDGKITVHRARNATSQSGLNFIAKKLAGESEPITFAQAWSLLVDSADTSVPGVVAFSDTTATITAKYSPTAGITWSGRTIRLRVGDSSPVQIASASPSDFSPALVKTLANIQLTFIWSITIGHSGKVLTGITGGSPYLAASHESNIVINIMKTLRGVAGQTNMSTNSLKWYTLSQEANPTDDQDIISGGTVSSPSVGRVDNVLVFTWDIPVATEPTEGYRERVIVPNWGTDPWSAHKVDLPQGVSGTIEVSIPLTVN